MSSEDKHERGSFIEGKNPYAPNANIQETSFGTRERLEKLRDEVDVPMSKFLRGVDTESSYSQRILNNLITTPDDYIYDIDGQDTIDFYKLVEDTLPKSFADAMQDKAVSADELKAMFRVAASDGIDTAYSLVAEAHPFTEESVRAASDKLNIMNERFVNSQLHHPETDEDVFSKCPGFRIAQALEGQMIRAVKKMEEEGYRVDLSIPKNINLGDKCKESVLNFEEN